MRRDRWRNLDWQPGVGEGAQPAGAAAPSRSYKSEAQRVRLRSLSGLRHSPHPAVAAARGHYFLKSWQGVVDALTPETLQHPLAHGAWLLRGLALARLGDWDASTLAFEQATRLDPEDAFTCCAHAAFLLHRERHREARGVLEAGVWEGTGVRAFRRSGVQEATDDRRATNDHRPERLNARTPERLFLPEDLTPVAEQLWGACEWAEGQRQLHVGAAREAASRFAAAERRFIHAAEMSTLARKALPERLGAVYVGQVAGLLAAGHRDAALQLYGRLRPADVRLHPSLEQFARDLHELCRLLPAADAHQCLAAATPLTALTGRLQMHVVLWDGAQPVTISWRNA